jgi:tetratricopeptide (TPR) repeat protein
MDIWKWVFDTQRDLEEAGNHRLAELINEIPTNASRGRLELAQAALPEALAAARAARLPWLEVYFRHWTINPRVCTRREGEAALKDTVSLFEFAHRPETVNCPQSVCTTQDIACCYANVDGAGYASERIAVCKETLARIDSSWGCFRCISSEMMNALVDAAKPEEALAFADQQLPLLQETGADQSVDWFEPLAQAQFAAGRYETALATLDYIEEQGFDSDNPPKHYARSCMRFRLLALLGRLEEAWAMLPPEEKGQEFGECLDLSAGLEVLLQLAPERNNYVVGRRTAAAVRRYSASGSHRLTLDALAPHVRLAVARGARWSAMQILELARPHLAKLKQPLGAPELFAELEAMVAAMPAVRNLPVPAVELADYLRQGEGRDAEQDLELLLAGAASLPSDAGLAVLTSHAMRACGGTDAARAYLWAFLRANPDADAVVEELESVLLDAHDDAGIQALAGILRDSDPIRAHLCLARFAFKSERWSEVGKQARTVLELEPDNPLARGLWSYASMRAGDFEQALELLEQLIAEGAAAGNGHWEAIVAASALRRWDRVRALGASLGMEFESAEGPIEEKWGVVRVQYEDDGEVIERFAHRTGPVTARIVSLSGSRRRQTIGQLVVFHPQPLEEVPEDEEAANQFVQLYKVVTVLEQSSYGTSYLVDGVHPGAGALEALTEAFSARGWKWVVHSEADYTVFDNETGSELPGVYFLVAAPVDTAAAVIDETLRELTAGYEHPMCWTGLAEAAGADVGYHEALMDRYEL